MNKHRLTTCQQPREYVGCERCSELLGVKGVQADWQAGGESPGLNPGGSFGTASLERVRGQRNSWCRGEIRRDQEEHRRRKRLAGATLTLRRESVGSKQD